MSIPEAVIDAASCQTRSGVERGPEARARRVINAIADHLPDSAVREALIAGNLNDDEYTAMRAAIIAALKDIVEAE